MPVRGVADALGGHPPLLVQRTELHRGLTVGPAVEHRGVDAAGQSGVPARRVGGLGAALTGHGLQGGDVDLHGSSSGPGPSRSRRTLGVGVAAHPGLSTVGSLSTDPRQLPSGCCRGGQDRGRDRLLGSRRPGYPMLDVVR
jgi:hypothetical protein